MAPTEASWVTRFLAFASHRSVASQPIDYSGRNLLDAARDPHRPRFPNNQPLGSRRRGRYPMRVDSSPGSFAGEETLVDMTDHLFEADCVSAGLARVVNPFAAIFI